MPVVTFTACAGNGARCQTCQDAPPAPALTTNDNNAARILQALDYTPTREAIPKAIPNTSSAAAPEPMIAEPCPKRAATTARTAVDAVDFGVRVLHALKAAPETSGYLRDRLHRLHVLTEHAILHGCLITWRQHPSPADLDSKSLHRNEIELDPVS